MDLQLRDRVYVVTGGSRGLGFAAAQALLAEGARVVLSGPHETSAAAAGSRLARGVSADDRVAWVVADNADTATPDRSVGGPAIAELGHHLRYGGKLVTYGALGGERTEIEVRRDLIYRDLSHHGFWMNNWLQRAPRAEIESTYRAILALVSRGELKARIDQTFPLSRYKEALARAERYERAGKVVFRPD